MNKAVLKTESAARVVCGTIAAILAGLGQPGCGNVDRSEQGRQDVSALAQGLTEQAPPVWKNDEPFVLLHGFFGWGRDELMGWKHFGGVKDIQQDLRTHGFETYTVAVGPISSNWDRAAEMFAQLLGGTVDYGYAHALQHGHARFGRSYEGMLPQLGTPDGEGGIHRVNIISHSMGVQTARVLVTLLANGSDAERAACPGGRCPAAPDGAEAPISPLYAGTAGVWVHGVGSLAGANNGSTLAQILDQDVALNELVSTIAKLINAIGADGLYDFKLDQFGLDGRRNGETMQAYVDRMVRSLIDNACGDTAFSDASVEGAARLNAWTPADPRVYYFSWTNSSSYRGIFTGRHYPVFETNLFLRPMVTAMGHYSFHDIGLPVTDRVWWENDGIVNTTSMEGPKLGSSDQIRAYDPRRVQPGVWQVVDHLDRWDHWDMIGLLDWNHGPNGVLELYRSVARTLSGNP